MISLEPPQVHFVRAALGWLELGNRVEALRELEALGSQWQGHSDVLEVYWLVYSAGGEWSKALQVATALWQAAPDRASGWLNRAYALRRVPEGGLQQAREALLPAFSKFPNEPVIPYNLACYACQLDELDEARRWLACAETAGGAKEIRRMALQDADLEPLWEEIRQQKEKG